MGLLKKDTAVLNENDKRIRNVIGIIGVIVIAGILLLNFFAGFGKQSRPVIYCREGKNIIYDIKDGGEKDSSYMCYSGGFVNLTKVGNGEYKAHFDSKEYYEAEKNGDTFDIYFLNGKDRVFIKDGISAIRFAQNGKDAVLFEGGAEEGYTVYFTSGGKCKELFDNCTDAAVVGRKKSRYFLYEQNGRTMFYNFKDEPYEMKVSKMDADMAMLSSDERKLMVTAGDDRRLYVFNVNILESNTTEAIEVGKNVIKASFTGLKSDFVFLEASGDLYYSSGGYTFKEGSGVKKYEAGYDVMTVYYLTDSGEFYGMYVGDEKKLDSGVYDFYYVGSNNTAVIKDFNNSIKEGIIYHIKDGNISETDRKAENFRKY